MGVEYQELYASLARYEDGWMNLSTTLAKRFGGGGLRATTRFRCNTKRLYAYRNVAFAYSVLKGIGYFASQTKYDNLRC